MCTSDVSLIHVSCRVLISVEELTVAGAGAACDDDEAEAPAFPTEVPLVKKCGKAATPLALRNCDVTSLLRCD